MTLPPGLKDVSRACGYSVGTVSRVLSGKARDGRISGEAERAVRAAAARLGYARDEVARALRMRTTRTIGIVVSDVANPFFGRIASAVERAVPGHAILVCNSAEDPARERRWLGILGARRVDGVLISPSGPDPAPALELARQGTAVVTFDREYPGRRFDAVVCDNRAMARRLAARLGRGRIGFVGGPPLASTHAQRLRGFLDAVPGGLAVCGADPAEAARRAAGCDGILFGNGPIAEAVIVELLQRAPERLWAMRLASFDDSPLFAAVPVTKALQPEEAMARRAVELLRHRIGGRNGLPRRVVLGQRIAAGPAARPSECARHGRG